MSEMDEAFAKLSELGYDQTDLAWARSFVNFSAELIQDDPENVERMKMAIDKMATAVSGILPDYDKGSVVGGFDASILDGALEPLSEATTQMFITIVGILMLSGSDGPPVTATYMKTAIDQYLEMTR